jgi:hypothetical protein
MRIRRDVVLRRLTAARDLLSSRDNWVQGTEAQDTEGNDISADQPGAVRFCAVGAIRRVTFADAKRRGESTFNDSYYNELERRVNAEVSRDSSISSDDIIDVNDRPGGHSRRRVVSLFNRAIKTLEGELS